MSLIVGMGGERGRASVIWVLVFVHTVWDSLRDNDIGTYGAVALAQALKTNTALTTLR